MATPMDISGRLWITLRSSLGKIRKSKRMTRFPDKEAVAGSRSGKSRNSVSGVRVRN